ncbi:MAG: RibD family protein [Myxococcota bacterium]|nr:RibD family protein [Myxococcota bacterium]
MHHSETDPCWDALMRLRAGEDTGKATQWSPTQLATWSLLAPLARQERWCVGHLAQSLDGRIAMDCGSSQWISGPADLVHTHRLRALSDAVVVGASTVLLDDPALTTRRVRGPSPTRVLLDSQGRIPLTHQVLQDDGAPTLWLVSSEAPATDTLPAHVERVVLPGPGPFPVPTLLRLLGERGLHRVFVEGGGLTVSRFIEQGCLDRLHLVVAPVILGSGRPSLSLPGIRSLSQALRPDTRCFPLGQDTLYELSL